MWKWANASVCHRPKSARGSEDSGRDTRVSVLDPGGWREKVTSEEVNEAICGCPTWVRFVRCLMTAVVSGGGLRVHPPARTSGRLLSFRCSFSLLLSDVGCPLDVHR